MYRVVQKNRTKFGAPHFVPVDMLSSNLYITLFAYVFLVQMPH